MSYDNITIATAMRQIRNNELVLPAIQRDFVWSAERIYRFLDSLLRGYPIGTLLFWNTKQRIQFREFVKDKTDDTRYTFQIKDAGRRGTMVLDGQQRLQSLYLALQGTHNREKLYFDVLSGNHSDDVSEARYQFKFLLPPLAIDLNKSNSGIQFWIPLSEIYNCQDVPERRRLAERYIEQSGIDRISENSHRLADNVEIAHSKLRTETILSHYTIDLDYGEDSASTPVDEILEIFVRTNSGGQVLSKSDLMFSLMQLRWEGAADNIEDLLAEVNTADLTFDKDFVLRCALVCCGQGARYDVDKLRDEAIVARIETEFMKLARAITNAIHFLRHVAKIRDERILGSRNSIIPFVYYLFHRMQQEPGDEANQLAMKHALYLGLMTSAFSRYVESRIDGVIREVFDPARFAGVAGFPLAGFRAYIRQREGRDRIDNWVLQRNITLLMNILEGGPILPSGQRRYRPEVDHIFPTSKLAEHGYDNEEINDFANLRLISKIDNIWKSNRDPANYFTNYPGLAEQYLIPTELLTYEQYPEFLLVRRRKIWRRIQEFLGLVEDDLPTEDRIVPGEENKVIDQLERQLRDLINEQLSAVAEGDYWTSLIPADVKEGVKQRIEGELARNPGKSWSDYATGRSRLDFCDVSDYETIIQTRINWPLFESTLKSRGEFQRHMSAVRRFRNSVKHGRPTDPVERLSGEAGILWLRRAFNIQPDEPEPVTPPPPIELNDGGDQPTPEDFHRLFTRMPVSRGHRQLYKALYDAGDAGLTYADLAKVMNRTHHQLVGVIGSLGVRVNNTPGYGQIKHPGGNMLFVWRRNENKWSIRLQPEARAALERLNPDWLHEMTP